MYFKKTQKTQLSWVQVDGLTTNMWNTLIIIIIVIMIIVILYVYGSSVAREQWPVERYIKHCRFAKLYTGSICGEPGCERMFKWEIKLHMYLLICWRQSIYKVFPYTLYLKKKRKKIGKPSICHVKWQTDTSWRCWAFPQFLIHELQTR